MVMTVKILKISSPCISLPLNHIYNKFLSVKFPTWLKHAEIKPLFKDDKNNMANYRLIPTSYSKVLWKFHIRKTVSTFKY
jgi:phosphatidylserine decarboxylase